MKHKAHKGGMPKHKMGMGMMDEGSRPKKKSRPKKGKGK